MRKYFFIPTEIKQFPAKFLGSKLDLTLGPTCCVVHYSDGITCDAAAERLQNSRLQEISTSQRLGPLRATHVSS